MKKIAAKINYRKYAEEVLPDYMTNESDFEHLERKLKQAALNGMYNWFKSKFPGRDMDQDIKDAPASLGLHRDGETIERQRSLQQLLAMARDL